MTRLHWLWGLIFLVAACGNSNPLDAEDAGAGEEPMLDEPIRPDEDPGEETSLEEAGPEDVDTRDGGTGQSEADTESELREEALVLEESPLEENSAEEYNSEEETGGEEQSLEPEEEPPVFCTRVDACVEPATCNLASGMCEPRVEVMGEEITIVQVQRTHLAPGDMVVVDGDGFFDNALLGQWTSAAVGDWSISGFFGLIADQNRVVFTLPEDVSGTLSVTQPNGDGGASASWPEPLVADLVPGQVEACTLSHPPAAGMPGLTALDMGPYAAGYTDVHSPDVETRIYYPAQCGGLRTPPAAGNFPFVLILHGDGCGHINYEFLASHLASWGFMSAMPPSTDGSLLVQVLDTGLNHPENWFSALLGHAAFGSAVIVGHSKGSERCEYMLIDEGETRVHGVMFLGPVNQGYGLGLPALMFSASLDFQASGNSVRNLWQDQGTPRYLVDINGGNHSQFTDHKHWEGTLGGIGDGFATITRNRQFQIVQGITLAFVQKMFGQNEPFSQWLDSPPLGAEIDFEKVD